MSTDTTTATPTACLVCTDDNGNRLGLAGTSCPNPNCEDGLVWPDDSDEGEDVYYGDGSGWTGYSTGE